MNCLIVAAGLALPMGEAALDPARSAPVFQTAAADLAKHPDVVADDFAAQGWTLQHERRFLDFHPTDGRLRESVRTATWIAPSGDVGRICTDTWAFKGCTRALPARDCDAP